MSTVVEAVARAIFADLAPRFTEVKDWERLYRKQAEAYRSAARSAIAAMVEAFLAESAVNQKNPRE